jgi:predicted anti-sigma-YlaC factor YlaD
MSDCQTYRNLIDEYLDGTITGTQLDELKEHARECRSCGQEFKRCALMQDIVQDAFAGATDSSGARTRVMAGLAAQPRPRVYRLSLSRATLAVAATILVAVGLLLGLAFGRAGSIKPAGVPLPAQVPMSVADLRGTILVRHEGSDVWQVLTAESDVHLGDTFHSAAKSGFTLELGGRSRIEVEQNSMLALTSYNGETQFFLEHGECTASLESPHGPFFIRTPHGRVEALGTEFTVSVTDE